MHKVRFGVRARLGQRLLLALADRTMDLNLILGWGARQNRLLPLLAAAHVLCAAPLKLLFRRI